MDITLLVPHGASWMEGMEGRGCQQEVGMGCRQRLHAGTHA